MLIYKAFHEAFEPEGTFVSSGSNASDLMIIDDDKIDKRYDKKVKEGHPWRQNSYEIEKVIKPNISK